MLERRKGIAVVQDASSADVQVEVLNAGQLETGAEVTRAGASTAMGVIAAESRTTKETKPQVHVRVTAGQYRIEYNGTDRRLKGAAQAVVEGVEKWIKQNRQRLEAQRPQG
jgi:diaminopimelate epimerase